MALVIVVCYDTEENGRSEYTDKTLRSLMYSVDFEKRHRLAVVDNGSCQQTKDILRHYKNYIPQMTLITLPDNLGTSKGLNEGIRLRKEHEHVCKCDNDVEIPKEGWLDELEEAIERDPEIGILGLKRKDLIQSPDHESEQYRSHFKMLNHIPGQRWITVEVTNDIMGTCTLFNWRLIDKIGGSAQPGLYGLEDCLYCLRSHLAGFYNAFLSHIEINHLDRGDNPYVQEKQRQAGEAWPIYHEWHKAYIDGTRPLYEEI